MAGQPKRRERAAGGASFATPERARIAQARALELAEGVDPADKLSRLRVMKALMGAGEWLPGYSSKALADAWSIGVRTVENDSALAWLMVRDAAGDGELGSYAVASIASSLDRSAEVADQLTGRLEVEVEHLEPKPLRDLAESWKAVTGESNRMAELLARAAGRISSGGVSVNVDARSVNLAVYPPAERALLERAQGGDEDAGRMARLLLASGATTLGELREWLLPAVTELYAETTTEGATDG